VLLLLNALLLLLLLLLDNRLNTNSIKNDTARYCLVKLVSMLFTDTAFRMPAVQDSQILASAGVIRTLCWLELRPEQQQQLSLCTACKQRSTSAPANAHVRHAGMGDCWCCQA
jgi:hypothetical protein